MNPQWIAEQRFRCTAPGGENFDVTIRIGKLTMVAPEDPGEFSHGRCRLAMAPLAKDCWIAGNNQFQALCLALDFLHTVFKAFQASGGRICWEDSDAPIDINSPWFAPLPALRDLGYAGPGATGR